MAELIGAAYVPILRKTDLLMFDRIVCGNPMWSRHAMPAEESASLDYLMEQGVLLPLESGVLDDSHLSETDRAFASRFLELKAATSGIDDPHHPLMKEFALAAHRCYDMFSLSRLIAIALRQRNMNACAIIRSRIEPEPTDDRQTLVLQIVIPRLPVPGEQHSLEEILDFRNQARSQGLTSGLSVWMNDMARGSLKPYEVADVLDDLVIKYERALKTERLSQSSSVIEATVVTTAEIAEGLIKFRWSELAKRLFSVRHNEVRLMKAEMGLPGRQVAFICEAKERFE